MLDDALKNQLQAYLQNLRTPIRLIASLDAGNNSAEMRTLLQEIASLSDKVFFDESGTDARKPSFVVAKEGETRGVRFAAKFDITNSYMLRIVSGCGLLCNDWLTR